MSDNVIKFRRPEKKPEPQNKSPRNRKPGGPVPGWLPFAVLLAIAVVIFFVQRSGAGV